METNHLPTIPTIEELRSNDAVRFDCRTVDNIVAIFQMRRDGLFTNFLGRGVAEIIGWKRTPGVHPSTAKTLLFSDGSEMDLWCDTAIPVILVPDHYYK